jgi:hypothetical protein
MAKDRETLDKRWHGVIADIIRAGQAQGEFPPGEADEATLRLRALMDGMSILLVLRDSEMTPQRMLQASLEIASREIGFKLPEVAAAK